MRSRLKKASPACRAEAQSLRSLVCSLSGIRSQPLKLSIAGERARPFGMVAAQGGDLDAPLKGGACKRWVLESAVGDGETLCALGVGGFFHPGGRKAPRG